MRLGVLDIGSNSAQLQVVEASSGAPPLPAHGVKIPTLLHDAVDCDGAIAPEGVERVAEAVAAAVRDAADQRVDYLYPYVTSVVRDAKNRDEVIDRIEALAGVRPQFLTGEQEARLTYLAVHRWYGWSAGRLLLLDIGGGSMEIALGRDAEPDLAISLPLGARRLTLRLLPDDPPSRDQLRELRRHVRDTIGEVADRLRWEGQPRRVIATSKTFKQLARLAGAARQRKGPFVRRELARRDVRHWLPQLAAMPAAERAKLRGVSAARAGQLLAGAVVADTTMAALNVRRAEICPWALREGIVLSHLEAITGQAADVPLQPVRHLDGPRPAPSPAVTPLHSAG
jgi:exopolyphosphatase / guanosine-5'-triphosphate,3'-diphosphate pyrophosphatase